MKNISTLVLAIFLSISMNAQQFDSYFQFDGSTQFTATTFDKIKLQNGNVLMSLRIDDSVAQFPQADYFYNETIKLQNGAGLVWLDGSNNIINHKEWFPDNTYVGAKFDIQSLAEDQQGNIYITGTFDGRVDMDPGTSVDLVTATASTSNANTYGHIIKLDAQGNYLWSRVIGSPNNSYAQLIPRFISVNSTNKVIVSGEFSGFVDVDPGTGNITDAHTNGYFKAFILELDALGNYQSYNSVALLNPSTSSSTLNHFEEDQQGNFYCMYYIGDSTDIDFGTSAVIYSPTTNPSARVLAKYDNNLNLLWHKKMPLNTQATFSLSEDDSLMVFGNYSNTAVLNDGNSYSSNNGSNDIFYEKWITNGICSWSKTMGSDFNENISSCETGNGSIYLVYSFEDSLNTNTGGNDVNLFATYRDIAMSRLDLSGNHISTGQIVKDSSTFLFPRSLLLVDNKQYIQFRTNGTADVDPGTNTVSSGGMPWATPYSNVVAVWQNGSVGIQDVSNTKEIAVYPNPTNNKLNLTLENTLDLVIYTLEGQEVLNEKLLAGTQQIDLGNLANGTYYLVARDNKTNYYQKIIKK